MSKSAQLLVPGHVAHAGIFGVQQGTGQGVAHGDAQLVSHGVAHGDAHGVAQGVAQGIAHGVAQFESGQAPPVTIGMLL